MKSSTLIIRYHLQRISVLVFLMAVTNAMGQNDQPKFALVIGVKSYQYVSPLQNTLNDATDISALLKTKGFQVIEVYDPKTKRELQDAVRKYFGLLQSKPKATGMLFYSGHGMQVDGSNYLIPTEANPQIKADIDDQCLNMDYVMQAIEQAGNPLNIFVLDACRNNPFRSFSRSSERGLSMVNTPKGSYIVYATKPGSVASDGTDRNGLFTSKLLEHMNKEGLKIEEVFKNVAADVSKESEDQQRPWIASDYTGDFSFTPVKVLPYKVDRPKPVAGDFGYGSLNTTSVIIKGQEWVTKNLSVGTFTNGDKILQAQTEEEWKKAGEQKKPVWCYIYYNEEAEQSYGKLYNWYAVTDARGLAPQGWHIAKNEEYVTLIENLGGELEAGEFLKTDTGWLPEEVLGGVLFSMDNEQIIQKSVLHFTPAGSTDADGTVNYYAQAFGNYWTSSPINAIEATGVALAEASGSAVRTKFKKAMGLSVRCIKDKP
jgi:uncharacterized protein (TIGR02145 family)